MDSFTLLLVCLHLFLTTAWGSSWSYGTDNGPNDWYKQYPDCGRKRQSPTDIPKSSNMEYDAMLKSFVLTGFDNPDQYKLKLTNNGHTAKVNVDGNLMVEGGGLHGRYKTAQFHFHWGHNNNGGSEHAYSGTRYPMELHIVNYNIKYGNLSNAVPKDMDGLAVLGFWFTADRQTDNPSFAPLLNEFANIKKKGTSADVVGLNLRSMLPNDLGMTKFYRYSGSLTTPPCSQSVVWTLFENKISISESQMEMFRKLTEDTTDVQTGKEHVIVDNFRPPQALNGRKVSRSFEISTSAASLLNCPVFTIASICLVLAFH